MFVTDSGKAKMVEVAQRAVHSFCGYGGGRCDCKYGATWRGEQTGCPEMRLIALMLDVMTPAEYERLIKRARKNSSRCYVAQRPAERAAERERDRLLAAVFDRLDAGRPDADGPGHAHVVPGVWDEINGPPVGGQPCEWCATWRRVREAIRALGTVPGAGEGQQ